MDPVQAIITKNIVLWLLGPVAALRLAWLGVDRDRIGVQWLSIAPLLPGIWMLKEASFVGLPLALIGVMAIAVPYRSHQGLLYPAALAVVFGLLYNGMTLFALMFGRF